LSADESDHVEGHNLPAVQEAGSAITNVSDHGISRVREASGDANNTRIEEELSREPASCGSRTRSKTRADLDQIETPPDRASLPSPPDKAKRRSRTQTLSRRKTMNTGHTDKRDSGHETGPVDKGSRLAVQGPNILGIMWDKASRAGRIEVMREVLYDMISALRARGHPEAPDFNPKLRETASLKDDSLPLSGLACRFQMLRKELEISQAGEQLHRLRKRVALAQFYKDYTDAQADPHAFLYPEWNEELSVGSSKVTRKRKRALSFHALKGRGGRLSTFGAKPCR